MIRHVVLLSLRDEHDGAELLDVMDGLAGLTIDGFASFEHGPNRDFECKSQDYPYGFIASFDDAVALSRYAKDPDHLALGARIVALCQGGADGIMVVDIAV